MNVMFLKVNFLNEMTVEHVRIGYYLSFTVQLRFSHVERGGRFCFLFGWNSCTYATQVITIIVFAISQFKL